MHMDSDEKWERCFIENCGKKFSSPKLLNSHVEFVHKVLKPKELIQESTFQTQIMSTSSPNKSKNKNGPKIGPKSRTRTKVRPRTEELPLEFELDPESSMAEKSLSLKVLPQVETHLFQERMEQDHQSDQESGVFEVSIS